MRGSGGGKRRTTAVGGRSWSGQDGVPRKVGAAQGPDETRWRTDVGFRNLMAPFVNVTGGMVIPPKYGPWCL